MALGLGSKKAHAPSNNPNENLTGANAEKDGKTDGVLGGRDSDTERQSDEDASINVGKQIELEAGNAIQYRTCSWQKVCFG
jgi:hypothetical protein